MIEEIKPNLPLTLLAAGNMFSLEQWTAYYLHKDNIRLPDLFYWAGHIVAKQDTIFGPFCIAKPRGAVLGN